MASSTSSSLASNPSKSSRISSLKAFKFIAKEKGSKPPPPPPKDLHHMSSRVLSPDTLSIPPNSPASPYHHTQFHQRASPDPSRSSLSLASSAASGRSQTEDSHSQRQSRLKVKASSLLTLVKRTGKSIKSPDPDRPSSSREDAGISTPWNFQHNIHVDEAFIGIPPSWSTQLASAGFTPEEIAAIQTRRANLYNDAPNLRINTAPPTTTTPILSRPSPRTTSLRRQFSDASLHSASQVHPKLPPQITSITQPALTSSPSSTSLHSVRTTTTNSSRNPASQNGHAPIPSTLHEAASTLSTSLASHSEATGGQILDHSRSQSVGLNGPPRKPFPNVASQLISSPPPAYTQSIASKKTRIDDASQTTSSHRQQQGMDSVSKSAVPGRRVSIIRNKRNSILPPRLSIHKDAGSLDLSSWSAELLSGISSSSFNSNFSDGSSRFALEQSITPSTNVTSPWSQPSSSKSSTAAMQSPVAQESGPTDAQDRRPGAKHQPSRPIPPIVVQEVPLGQAGGDSPAPPTGWAEPASATRLSPSSPRAAEPRSASLSATLSEFDGLLDKDIPISPSAYSAALEDSHSPVLPLSPEAHTDPLSSSKAPGKPRRNNSQRRDADPEDPDESFLHVDDAQDQHANRYSSRSSSSTLTVTGYAESALVRNASVVRRTSAYVIDKTNLGVARQQGRLPPGVTNRLPPLGVQHVKHPSSPLSSHFGSEDGSPRGSLSSGSPSQDHPTPTTDTDLPLGYYMGATYTPSSSRFTLETKSPVHMLVSSANTFGGVQEEEEEDDGQYGSDGVMDGVPRPTIVIDHSSQPSSPPHRVTTPDRITPITPAPRYRGWLSEVVKPLEEFIDEAIDPREYYIDLQEIAEGESGSVFAAQIANYKDLTKLRLDPALTQRDRQTLDGGEPVAIAIKSVAIVPSGSPKLLELERELKLMKGLSYEYILGMDALYVDLVEDSLWIRMELMERSLADVISLVDSGLVLLDRMLARFASDVLQALQFLQRHNIAHRDVRSDNLLLNLHGILKLADFSAAAQVSPSSPMQSEVVGVPYWQAPEVRSPPYNALKVDVWSLGATVWEMAEAEPPFASSQQLSDRWPPLSKPKLFSPVFHDFLRQCSEPAASRPSPATLCSHPFVMNACGRSVIMQLLSQCMTIEKQQYQNEEES
ncbi:hypothetical protein F5887DRAFT_1011267 [Amanita rubescens]|nr:hypothetical protein F5887DRAFT_1011267 [Amanita rubescens]